MAHINVKILQTMVSGIRLSLASEQECRIPMLRWPLRPTEAEAVDFWGVGVGGELLLN